MPIHSLGTFMAAISTFPPEVNSSTTSLLLHCIAFASNFPLSTSGLMTRSAPERLSSLACFLSVAFDTILFAPLSRHIIVAKSDAFMSVPMPITMQSNISTGMLSMPSSVDASTHFVSVHRWAMLVSLSMLLSYADTLKPPFSISVSSTARPYKPRPIIPTDFICSSDAFIQCACAAYRARVLRVSLCCRPH